MASVRIQAKLSTDDLLKAIDQLDQRNLDRLLQKINQGFPQQVQQRYNWLIARRKLETLTDAEHAELLKLTDQIEHLEKQRIEYLLELAQLRRTTLNQVMQQ